MMGKRNDLQGIRAIAMLFVLLFHFYPTIFPNGYLGVDIFFVLSGFFLTLTLSRSELTSSSVPSFWFRRIRRLVPLYYLVVLMAFGLLICASNRQMLLINTLSAVPAIHFHSNEGQSVEMAYEFLLSMGEDVFTHTWSLSVEMQFYLIAPILYFLVMAVPKENRYIIAGFITLASLIFHCTAAEHLAFNNMFARIWQFAIGAICFVISDTLPVSNNPSSYDKKKDDDFMSKPQLGWSGRKKKLLSTQSLSVSPTTLAKIYFVALTALLGFCLLSHSFEKLPMRLCVTVFSAILISIDFSAIYDKLHLEWLTYIGDISYALYLVHWPICTFIIKNYQHNLINASHIGLIVSIGLAVLLTEFYEKKHAKFSNLRILLLIVVLYGGCSLTITTARTAATADYDDTSVESIQKYHKLMDESKIRTLELDEVLQVNNYLTTLDLVLLNNEYCDEPMSSTFGYCDMNKALDESANQTALIIGNSYAANLASLVYEVFHSKFNRMSQQTFAMCEALLVTPFRPEIFRCEDAVAAFDHLVKVNQPDYLFVLARPFTMAMAINGPLENDEIIKTVDRRLAEWSQHVKERIIMLDSFPAANVDFLSIYNSRLQKDKATANMDDLIDYRFQSNRVNIRHAYLAARHPKIHLIDVASVLTVNGTFRFIDEATGISYFTGGVHFSSHGKEKIRPLLEAIREDM